jgi:signal transduction histidine kinase
MRLPGLTTQRALRIGFLTLLAVCVAQAAYWIIDQVRYTASVQSRFLEAYERDRDAAQRLLALGVSTEKVGATFPHFRVGTAGALELAPSAVEVLQRERHRRLNRYGWEGAFFLLVLLGAMGVVSRALRQDAELRRRQQGFLASVSHEFKSPLAALRLSLETLELRDPPREARAKLLSRSLDDLARMEGMVTNLLDSAQIEEGRVRLVPQRLALLQAAAGAVEELAERAREAGVRVELSIPPDLEIEADPVAVRAVLRNLLDNALKSSAAAHEGEIRVSARAQGAHALLEVADSGLGFPPEQADMLFGKFYQWLSGGSARGGGAGLGLYIVRRFLELEGGWARAHSDGPGRGATFTAAWRAAREAAA